MKVRLDDIIYERGKNLIHFEVKENCLKQVSGVTYLGWDMYREKGFRARVGIEELEEKVGGRKDWRQQGKGGGGKWESTYADYSLRDQKEARERAEAKLRNLSYQYLKAEGSGEGNSALLAGMRVMMKQVGKAYSGEYIAEVVIHELSEDEGYITRFFLKRNMMDEEFGKGETVIDRHADEAYRAKREAAAEKEKRKADEEDEEEAEDKSPQFSNVRWVKKGKEVKEALVDDEVSLCFDVQNINNGQRIKITIWEHDEDNEHDHVADLTGTVENGQIAKIWKVVYTPDEDDGSTSAQELKEKGYTLPEYHFVAEYKGVVSGESPVLEVKDWVKKRLRDKSSNVIFKNTKYTLRLADGKEINGITDAMGYMQEIYAVPFGILNISIDKDLQ
jgi:hypothetical protein